MARPRADAMGVMESNGDYDEMIGDRWRSNDPWKACILIFTVCHEMSKGLSPR